MATPFYFHAAGWASRPMTAYVNLAGELRAAFKSLRQHGRARLRLRAAQLADFQGSYQAKGFSPIPQVTQ